MRAAICSCTRTSSSARLVSRRRRRLRDAVGGKAYPIVSNSGGPFFAPFLRRPTDFASLDRLTSRSRVRSARRGQPNVPARGGAPRRRPPATTSSSPVRRSSPHGVMPRSASRRGWISASPRISCWPSRPYDRLLRGRGRGCKTPITSLATRRSTLRGERDLVRRDHRSADPSDAERRARLTVRTPISLTAEGTLTPNRRGSRTCAAPSQRHAVDEAPLMTAPALATSPWIGLRGLDIELDARSRGGPARRRRSSPPDPFARTVQTSIASSPRYVTRSACVRRRLQLRSVPASLTLRARLLRLGATTSRTHASTSTRSPSRRTLGARIPPRRVRDRRRVAAASSIPRLVVTGQGDVRPVNARRTAIPWTTMGDLLPAVNEGAYRGFRTSSRWGSR